MLTGHSLALVAGSVAIRPTMLSLAQVRECAMTQTLHRWNAKAALRSWSAVLQASVASAVLLCLQSMAIE